MTYTATNGQITGTPTTASASQTYTVTVYNNGGVAATTTFSLQVVLPPAPGTFTYSPAPPMVFTQGTLITSETPSANSQPLYTAQAAYIITNNSSGLNSGTGTANTTIPGITGLVFSPSTGVISGTPTSVLTHNELYGYCQQCRRFNSFNF